MYAPVSQSIHNQDKEGDTWEGSKQENTRPYEKRLWQLRAFEKTIQNTFAIITCFRVVRSANVQQCGDGKGLHGSGVERAVPPQVAELRIHEQRHGCLE